MDSKLLNKKLEHWEHQLLDLGKRNKMINYRETQRSTLRITEPSPDELFRRLAVNEEVLTFQRSVDKDTDIRVFSILSLLETLSSPLPVTIGDIKTPDSIIERQKTLKNMRAKSRLAQEEQGTNILYMSFGFLEWKEGKGASEQKLRSPLILVPATLTLESLNSPFKLSKHEDDIVLNPTLEYYIKNEYGTELPHFDSEKETPDEYFKKLEPIADRFGWRISNDVSLGLLSFLKITMYNDLIRNEERIRSNAVIRAMSGDNAQVNEIPAELRSFDVDSISTRDCYQVMSADSSQQDAILYSKNNISFVMQGPPGTGKSQTITNIIAEALADGKKVLFVSEKMAALQVVYRRLQEAHLAEFCLPLHSYKANKKDILSQIGANLSLKQTHVKDSAIADLEELLSIRKELNAYAEELHRLNPELNMSCYEIYSKLEEINSAPFITFDLEEPLSLSHGDLQKYTGMLRQYALSLRAIGCRVSDNPWRGLTARVCGYEYAQRMQENTECIKNSLDEVRTLFTEIPEIANAEQSVAYADAAQLADTAEKASLLPEIPEKWLEDIDLSEAEEAVKDTKELYISLKNAENEAQKTFLTSIYGYDTVEWTKATAQCAEELTHMPLIKGKKADYFADNAERLCESFESLKTHLGEADSAMAQISDMLGTPIPSNPHYHSAAAEFITEAQKNILIPQKWLADDPDKLKRKAEKARSTAGEIYNYKTYVIDRLAEAGNTEYDFENWKEKLVPYVHASVPSAEELERYTSAYTQGLKALIKTFTAMKNNLLTALDAMEKANAILGTSFSLCGEDISAFEALISLISDNEILPTAFFTEDTHKIRGIADEARAVSEDVLTRRAELLNDWEPSILTLDFEPILRRYKTDYTGFFKFLNPQYGKDQKLLRSMSRNVIKKLDDSTATELLGKLKAYHESLAYFSDEGARLYGVFSVYYAAEGSAWGRIYANIATAEKISAMRPYVVCAKLIELLSRDHSAQITELKAHAYAIRKALDTVKKLKTESKLSLDPDAKDFRADYTVDMLTKYENTAKDVKTYYDKLIWFGANNAELTEKLSPYYRGMDSDWDGMTAAIDSAKKLRRLPIDTGAQGVRDLLCRERAEDCARMEALLSRAVYSTAEARKIIEGENIKINIGASDFSAADVMPRIDEYAEKLRTVASKRREIVPHLCRPDTKAEEIYHGARVLDERSALLRQIEKKNALLTEKFDFPSTSAKTDWEAVTDALESTRKIKASAFYTLLRPIVNSDPDKKELICALASKAKAALGTMAAPAEWMGEQFSGKEHFSAFTLSDLKKKIEECIKNIDMREKWIDYLEAREECVNNRLADFISKTEEAGIFSDIERIFLKGFYHMWLREVMKRSDAVRRFRKNSHNERIKRFIELDDLQLLIAQMRIREKLIESLPSQHQMLKATDEMAILNKELGKKRNIMPLRKLFKSIPNLLLKLKPCLMMSPLSVSYFLETEAYHFDLVIFDEASQIFPEDAIGAIFRGSQIIIAGDSKQLPPTSFFSSATNNTENEFDSLADEDGFAEKVSDSILEESASVLPNRTLLWHYRSKHENLISFSNREIYGNSLITFPSSVSKAPDMGVEYVYVADGCYDRGGKKYNLREAMECVRLVAEHIKKHPDRSLGIIAFSENQQTAIENAITDFREKNPAYEGFFDESKDEPFFVKNLENVQGDERDTIIFSICYAKDANGKMYMNFGPLGLDGGERRLNVAITRAKCNIKLVGSILPSDIDLGRARSEGARMLRSYIDFAMRGEAALRPAEASVQAENSDDFCTVIAAFLVRNGYRIKRNIGCSDYKIDIGIVNPSAEGEYIAGIECDGYSYAQAKTARDRDHLRKSVLENMGWNLYRVWSTEWMRNPEAEGRAILDFISSVYDKSGKIAHTVRSSNTESDAANIDDIATEQEKTVKKQSVTNPYNFAFYREARCLKAKSTAKSQNAVISDNILHIAGVEQPMHMDVLYKRLSACFPAGKVTESMKAAVDSVISNELRGKAEVDGERFIRLLPHEPITVRIPREKSTPRPMEYIHTQEVALAMLRIAEESCGITAEDLTLECAKVFGFERKGPKIKAKTDEAIKYLTDSRKIRIVDGKVQLTGETE